MMSNREFDGKSFVARLFRMKGHDPAKNEDVAVIMQLQWKAWNGLMEKHRIAMDTDRAEKLLVEFGPIKTYGPAELIEAFGSFLSGQPKELISAGPDWEAEGQRAQNERCQYCDGCGLISDVPCESPNGRYEGTRNYSFRCTCFAGFRFPNVAEATPEMLDFAIVRRGKEIDRARNWARERGIDDDTLPQFRIQWRRWLNKQMGKIGQPVGSNAGRNERNHP